MVSVAGMYAARPLSPWSDGSIKPVSVFHIKAPGTTYSRLSITSLSIDYGAIPKHSPFQGNASLRGDYNVQQSKRNPECLFRYDKAVPEQLIDKPIGLSLSERKIGNKPRCIRCEAKGVVLCPTCAGSGLYVDSILESQGIIVKVRCLEFGALILGLELAEKAEIKFLKIYGDSELVINITKGCGGNGNIMCSNCGGRGHL